MLLVCMPVQQCMPRIWMVACYYVGPMPSTREGCNGAVALVSLSPIHLYVDFLLTVFFVTQRVLVEYYFMICYTCLCCGTMV